jgi:hypothetical protein
MSSFEEYIRQGEPCKRRKVPGNWIGNNGTYGKKSEYYNYRIIKTVKYIRQSSKK